MRAIVATWLVGLAVSPPARAQPAAVPAPSSPAPSPAADEAWRAYDDAFATAARGDTDGARTQLLQLQTRWPGHPAGVRGGSLARRGDPRASDPDAPSKLARGELVFWSTVGGVFVGSNVCGILGCESDRETAAVYIASVGGALALAVLASQRGVRDGEAQIYNSAQTWGGWNGLALAESTDDDANRAAIALGSQTAGLVVGIGLWQTWRPTQGAVALTNTGLLWSTVLTVWLHLAADAEDSLSLGRVAIAGDLGILAGALVSTQLEMSRGRTLLIDLGGILGILAGGVVAVGTDSSQGAGIALLVGNLAGLGIAAAVTADWGAPDVATPVAPMPIAGPSGSVGLGIGTNVRF